MQPGAVNAAIIAIVDDDRPFREALASVLKAAGFGVTIYGSAEEYLSSFGRHATTCLVLDVRMPGMGGPELQRRMVETGSSIPIIFVTGHRDDSLHDLLIRAGAKGFLSKPVRSERVIAEIGAAINKRAEDEKPLQ